MFVMSLLIVASGRYVTFLRLSGPVRAAVLFVPPPLFRWGDLLPRSQLSLH